MWNALKCDIMWYQPGKPVLLGQEHPYPERQEVWFDSVPQKAWTQPRKVQKHIWQYIWRTPRKLLPSRIFLLFNQTSDFQQQNVHYWNEILNIWITCWWIHSRASGLIHHYVGILNWSLYNVRRLTEKHAAAAHLSKTVPAGAKLRSNVVGES